MTVNDVYEDKHQKEVQLVLTMRKPSGKPDMERMAAYLESSNKKRRGGTKRLADDVRAALKAEGYKEKVK